MSYFVELDDNGDEVLVFNESAPWSLPKRYRDREVRLATYNLADGHHRVDLAVSRNVLHLAVQVWRSQPALAWGSAFARDPRRFSSTPVPR